MIAISDLKSLDAQVNAQMDAANTAVLSCSTMVPSDVTAWSGLYAAWTATHEQWTATQATLLGGLNVGGDLVVLYYAEDLFDKMLVYQNILSIWQIKIHTACPAYTIPPGIVVKPADSNRTNEFFDKAEKAVEAVGGAILLGVVGYLTLKVVEIVGAVRSATR